MGLGPPLYVAGDQLACHGEAYFCQPVHPKSADSVRSFQFGVCCFDPCADLIPVLPFSCLLDGVHPIPQAKLGGDLQTKIPDRVTGIAAFQTMVGSPHRTSIEHRARSTEVSVKDRMERTAGAVVTAQYAMVFGTMAHGTCSYQTFRVEGEKVSAHDIVGEPAPVYRSNEFDALLYDLRR